MASINLAGVLRDPLGEFSYMNKIRFTHNTTTGQTLKGFRSVHKIADDGSYDIDVEYGNVQVETHDILNQRWINNGVITINSDTPATDLPSLLGITTPATDEDLLVFQALVEDANQAAQAAQDAQAETEALFKSVADSSPANLSPDVSIPFNEGIEMERGYGNRDAFGNRSVDFNRASETGNINKSGVSESLGIDEPAITSDGICIYGEYTNELLWSEDLLNPVWEGANASASTDGTLAPDGLTTAYKITSTVAQGSLQQKNIAISGGETVTSSCAVKDGGGGIAILVAVLVGGSAQTVTASYDFSTGEFSLESGDGELHSETLNNGWVNLYITTTDVGGNTSARLYIRPSASVGSVYATNAQVVLNSGKPYPYIKTEDTPVTRAPDIVSIPMMNNMPAAGKPFTIVCDFTKSAGVGFLFETNARGIGAFTAGSGAIVARGVLTQSNVTGVLIDGIRYRFALVFDGDYCTGYLDGNIGLSSNTVDIGANQLNDFFIGTNSSNQTINSEIKNFKIYHRALSDNEIKALGGAK